MYGLPPPAIAKTPGAIVIPHLGASAGSEDNCARMAAEELIDYLERPETSVIPSTIGL